MTFIMLFVFESKETVQFAQNPTSNSNARDNNVRHTPLLSPETLQTTHIDPFVPRKQERKSNKENDTTMTSNAARGASLLSTPNRREKHCQKKTSESTYHKSIPMNVRPTEPHRGSTHKLATTFQIL